MPVYAYYQPRHSLYESTMVTVRWQLGSGSFEQARGEGRAIGFEHVVA